MARPRFSLADQLRNQLEVETTPTQGTFCEEPVPLDVFLKDKKYMNQGGLTLSDRQYNLIRHMEQIYFKDTYPLLVENFGEYWSPVRFCNQFAVQWGKGSGKDLSVQFAVSRIAYLALCLENPQEYYGLAEQSDIHILNVAMNSAQARRAFFKPLSQAIRKSPWFSDKLRYDITDQAKQIQLIKQVGLISGHSKVENFEGLSPLAVILDEISGFDSEENKVSKGIVESQQTAEAVYDIALTSASTRFAHTFKVAAISYPRYKNDPIQRLCFEGEEDIKLNGLEKSIFYVDGPAVTWEVNPRFRNEEFINIPETDILVPNIPVYISHYQRDRAKARSMYECKPERTANRFIRNDSAIASSFPKQPEEWVEPLTVQYYWGYDQEGQKADDSYEFDLRAGWQVQHQFNPSLVPMEGAVYALHADLAITGDRAGIAMCHIKNWERREHLQAGSAVSNDALFTVDDRPIIKVDFVTYYEANLQATTDDDEVQPREVQIRWFRNLIRELRRRGFVIGLITFDNFQSTDAIQILTTWGIEADKLSVDRTNVPYTTLRDVIYDGRLEGYFHPLLQIELEGLSQLPNGKIDHPPGGSKDMADALCGAVTNAVLVGGDEGSEPEQVDVSYGRGYEVSNRMGATDAFWGNVSLDMSRSDFEFANKF